mgnify:CR=1 FL=1
MAKKIRNEGVIITGGNVDINQLVVGRQARSTGAPSSSEPAEDREVPLTIFLSYSHAEREIS